MVKKIVFPEKGGMVIKYKSNCQLHVGEETQVGIGVYDRFKREK